MNRFILLSALFTFLLLASCTPNPNDQIDEGKIVENTYHSEEIGWTIEIPKDFEITSRDKIQSAFDRGAAVVEEGGVIVDASELKFLINFNKDQFNSFESTSEKMKGWTFQEWDENNQVVKDLIAETLTNQGIDTDTLSYLADIDGLEFDVFHTRIYGPNGKVLLEQDMYTRLINGYDFSAIISYNDHKLKESMLNAFKRSKFTYRD